MENGNSRDLSPRQVGSCKNVVWSQAHLALGFISRGWGFFASCGATSGSGWIFASDLPEESDFGSDTAFVSSALRLAAAPLARLAGTERRPAGAAPGCGSCPGACSFAEGSSDPGFLGSPDCAGCAAGAPWAAPSFGLLSVPPLVWADDGLAATHASTHSATNKSN